MREASSENLAFPRLPASSRVPIIAP